LKDKLMSIDAKRPVVLVILDGWGIGRDEPGNAILAADTPIMDGLMERYPSATLLTSGEAVGLPAGQMGNSEVGHLNLGAGFIVYQWITRIDKSIREGDFYANTVLCRAIDRCVQRGTTLHVMGLVSDGGVHSHTRHLVALLDLAKRRGLSTVRVHAFTDGRDTDPHAGLGFVNGLQARMADIGIGTIATVSGRYYAMDRDKRWERTKLAYDAIVDGRGPSFPDATAAIKHAYENGVTDEFIAPSVIGDLSTAIRQGDEVIVFNFRSDRCRQLTEAMSTPGFTGFARTRQLWESVPVTTMTRYEAGLPVSVAFEPHDVTEPVARVISEAGKTQFHCAETEKYAHVSFFFNGGREEPFPGEERTLVSSPMVATYDLQPSMSAPGVTDAAVAAIESIRFDFVIVNFANCDMVGHTGVFSAAVSAVHTVDSCLGRVVGATLAANGVAIVTADHGNAEEMIVRETGMPMTAHTTNPVPVVLVTPENHPYRQKTLRSDGILSSIAPTILRLMELAIPRAMTTPPLV
jgi:2,3-bisphosphoglycerate-independent phosphoglycerate mutase